MKLVEFTSKGIYCIPGNFYLDPWRPVDMAVISHGHGDHAKWGPSTWPLVGLGLLIPVVIALIFIH